MEAENEHRREGRREGVCETDGQTRERRKDREERGNCSTICETSPLISLIVNNHSITQCTIHIDVRISKLTKESNIRFSLLCRL